MPQSLVKLLVHIVFSTKYRRNLITPEVEPELFALMSKIIKSKDARLIIANGTANHVHLLVSHSKNIALSLLVAEVKRQTSRWIKTKGIEFRDFHWQDGYGAFSIGESAVPIVKGYIERQKEKHRRQVFEKEYILFLKKYKIEYEQDYLWD
ncbi:MAG: IS200/IS605 family transposase [Blastocatellia bacterium]